jgi:hypothetical protein
MTTTKAALALRRWGASNSLSTLAETLRLSRQSVHGWTTGRARPASPELRLAVERLTGIPAGLWLTQSEVLEANRLARLTAVPVEAP